MSDKYKAKSLEETPTWAVAAVVFVLVAASIVLEHVIHMLEKLLKKKHKPALLEALGKVKLELMLMGFISLMLTVLQAPISEICISKSVAATWHPCSEESKKSGNSGKYEDKCQAKDKVAFVSTYGIHQLHIFIFVLAIVHVLYCIITYVLGRTKMSKWKKWEDETKTIEYQYHNDPERFRFARDTSFGRRHLKLWSKKPVFLWIVCFFRQFFRSVTKIDYLTLRHGFIMAHLGPGSGTRFDFQDYIKRSLEDDFKVVVGISPVIWFVAVLFLLTNTYGWFAYLWLPFVPLIVILVVGAKLEMIITQLGLSIQERGEVVKGAPVVQPGDELFWFGRPRLILFLIHLVLFQNAFQIAFFIWTLYSFSLNSCFHDHTEDVVIRITMGVVIQILCSYVTLPLYALVTQMGSGMRPTIFNDRVQTALKSWHHTAKRNARHGRHSESHTPMSSMPTTPTSGMSPVHLLQNYRSSTAPNSLPTSPARDSYYENDQWDPEALTSVHDHELDEFHHKESPEVEEQETTIQEPIPMQLPPGPGPIRTQHDMRMGSSFAFRK